jgi:FAD/FMN-containing dehydrogenase
VPVTRITKDDDRYEALSQGFNQRWVATPDYIAMASSTEDVVAAVEEAVGGGKRISVRSGGHCYENFVSNPEVQVIIDVSGLDQVYRDEQRQAFCLGAGATNCQAPGLMETGLSGLQDCGDRVGHRV